MSAKILIVDDDPSFCRILVDHMQKMQHSVTLAHTLKEGLDKSKARYFDVIFLDVNLPDGSGLEHISSFQTGSLPPEIIIMTGFGDADGARLAMENGVWDYLSKGASLDAAKMSLRRALQYRESRMAAQKPVSLHTAGVIGECPAFKSCLDFVAQAAGSMAHILVTGETGTGKELIAQAIHDNSRRAGNSLVVVDCAALPETLIESTLFGHEKGAFTGADKAQEGLVLQADGGTLLLDEVGELPLEMQKKFLRVLQERKFRPVGSDKEQKSDFRLVAATNRNLETMVEEGKFRRDLLYRLKGLTIKLPPLRDRREDIRPLTLHYIKMICDQQQLEPKGISPDFVNVLEQYEWPGNVRELINTIRGAVSLAGNEPILFAMHLPAGLRAKVAQQKFPADESPKPLAAGAFIFAEPLPPLSEVRAQMEMAYLKHLVLVSENNIQDACRISGLSRARVYAKLKEHGLALDNGHPNDTHAEG